MKTITLLFFAVFTSVLSAQTVNIEGDPYTGNPYPSIQAAIDASSNAADIILITGVHTESITINKGITLRGTNPLNDIIEANVNALTATTRVIYLNGGALNITIENLGIRHGNTTGTVNGGGIYGDKITDKITLKNLIIENNFADRNGGGLAFDGCIADIIECTIRNNQCVTNGGGMIISPNTGSAINSIINIKQSLIHNNSAIGTSPTATTAGSGGGIYINAANSNFQTTTVNIENSTISNNSALGTTGGPGGGAICTQNGTTSGMGTLKLVHTTVYNNSHTAPLKSGIQFGGTSGSVTNFSAYNSIIVSADEVAVKALNFANSNTTNVVNCILGGLNAAPTLVADVANNNLTGTTATGAGLTGTLTDLLGGNTKVIAITEGSAADDYCSAPTGITLPTIDQRGYGRVLNYDAGAFEFGGVPTVGLEDYDLNSAVKVFPNPASHILNIKSLNTVTKVNIFDITGKQVFESSNINNESIDVSNLKTGIYMLRFEDASSNFGVKKLVITK